MHQFEPIPYRFRFKVEPYVAYLSIEVKYFKQDIVYEHADCRCMSVILICAKASQFSLQVSRRGAQSDALGEGISVFFLRTIILRVVLCEVSLEDRTPCKTLIDQSV